MARILLSHFTPVRDEGKHRSLCYYDGLVRSLVEQGNDVLQLFSSDFLARPWNGGNEVLPEVDADRLKQAALAFRPDVCFAFNNSVPSCIADHLECPIILWHGDSFMYFNDRDRIIADPNRYLYVCPFEDTHQYLRREVGVRDDRIIRVMPATGVRPRGENQDKDLSFIGSVFFSGYGFLEELKRGDGAGVRRVADRLRSRENTPYEAIAADEARRDLPVRIPFAEISALSSSQNRTLVLGHLSEMDLHLFGTDDWYGVGLYLPWVAMAYRPRKIYSLDHNEAIYNSSRVSLNVSHSQATVGFPWRIMDIMASQACLLTDRNEGISEFIKGYVDLPMYETPCQAKELARKLVQDKKWRDDIVRASQACIEARGRWEQRFPLLEEALRLRLLKAGDNPGTHRILERTEFMKPEPPPPLNLRARRLAKMLFRRIRS